MDQRLKTIKLDLNNSLGRFDIPECIIKPMRLSFGLADMSEEEEKEIMAKLDTFEEVFFCPENREKFFFSEDDFAKQLLSAMATFIFADTLKGSDVLKKYYGDVAAKSVDEETVEAAFEYYYNTGDEDEEGRMFLLWHIAMMEKLPESVLKKLEEFMAI